MIRRAAASLALIAALAGCTTFSDADAVARANGDELSQELLDDLVDVVIGDAAALPEPSTATAAEPVRNVITQWIQITIIQQYLDEVGIEITDAAVTDAENAIANDPALGEITDDLRAFFVDTQAAINTFNQLPDPQASFDEAFADADVHVASRYGTFDDEFLAVVPLGLAQATSL